MRSSMGIFAKLCQNDIWTPVLVDLPLGVGSSCNLEPSRKNWKFDCIKWKNMKCRNSAIEFVWSGITHFRPKCARTWRCKRIGLRVIGRIFFCLPRPYHGLISGSIKNFQFAALRSHLISEHVEGLVDRIVDSIKKV